MLNNGTFMRSKTNQISTICLFVNDPDFDVFLSVKFSPNLIGNKKRTFMVSEMLKNGTFVRSKTNQISTICLFVDNMGFDVFLSGQSQSKCHWKQEKNIHSNQTFLKC